MKINQKLSKEASEKIIEAQKFLEDNNIPLKIHLEFNPFGILVKEYSKEDIAKSIDLAKHINFYTRVF